MDADVAVKMAEQGRDKLGLGEFDGLVRRARTCRRFDETMRGAGRVCELVERRSLFGGVCDDRHDGLVGVGEGRGARLHAEVLDVRCGRDGAGVTRYAVGRGDRF